MDEHSRPNNSFKPARKMRAPEGWRSASASMAKEQPEILSLREDFLGAVFCHPVIPAKETVDKLK